VSRTAPPHGEIAPNSAPSPRSGNRNILALVAVSLCLSIGSVVAQLAHLRPADPAVSCGPLARKLHRLEMLFGTARPGGPVISDAEWQGFLDGEITPRFPAGLTVLRGPGQWLGSDGRLTREQAFILVVWHDAAPETEAGIEAIRDAYKARFSQESVMRVDSVSCVSF
jgi:hypothetical protein